MPVWLYVLVYMMRCAAELFFVCAVLQFLLKCELKHGSLISTSQWVVCLLLSAVYAYVIPPDNSLLVSLPHSTFFIVVAYGAFVLLYNIKAIVFSFMAFKGNAFHIAFFSIVSQLLILTINRTLCSTFSIYERFGVYEAKTCFNIFAIVLCLISSAILYWLKYDRLRAHSDWDFSRVPKAVYLMLLLSVISSLLLTENKDDLLFRYIFEDFQIPQWLSLLFIIIFITGVIYLLALSNQRNTQRKVVAVLKSQMNALISHYEAEGEIDKMIHKFRHDYNNHMLCLKSLLESGKAEEAYQYICSLNSSLDTSILEYNTGNYIGNAILSDKARIAKKQGIDIVFNGHIPSDIDNVDMCIIISNSIDNAIEACTKLDAPSEISVEVQPKSNYLFFEISNPVERPVQIENDTILSTKENSELHGIGLLNIHEVAKKYNGTVKLSCKELVFTIEIVLKII